jgi:carboxypeptidase C (cathepsin A)
MRFRLALTLVLATVLALPLPSQGRGGQADPGAPQSPSQSQAQSPAREEYFGAAEEKTSVTQHTMRLRGRDVAYTATVGTIPIRLDNSQVLARMFFVAYTKDGEDRATRPVSFLFNGGPGAASIWLHMGSFAPKIAQMAPDGFQPAPPFRLQDNENTLLESTDLVFVDAISTGFSRTAPGISPAQFHGQEGDIRAFGEFINGWITAHNRWSSPKYLMGESYGTIRSAGLAAELQQRHGIELNGIVMISALLTYQTLAPTATNDIAWASLIQTFAADAWYHKKLAPDLQAKSLKQVVDEARTLAWGEYTSALVKGGTLTTAERKAMAAKLARITGLSEQFILDANLRVSAERFRKELLRDQRLAIGRLDGRFTSIDGDAAGERQEFDPSNQALQGPYTAMFHEYVRNELKWQTELRYPTSGNVRPWTYVQNSYMDMTEALRGAMTRNPYLKVLVTIGYYDMATIAGGAEHNFNHIAHDKQVTDRVSYTYYEAGHMMYIRPSEHRKLTADIAKFVAETRAPKAVP